MLFIFQAYPSLKPLATWVTDLLARMEFMHDWINNGIPSVSLLSSSLRFQAFVRTKIPNAFPIFYKKKRYFAFQKLFRKMSEKPFEVRKQNMKLNFKMNLNAGGYMHSR